MTLAESVREALDPSVLLRSAGIEPDAWQRDLLRRQPHRALVCTTRQAGKTLTAASLALHRCAHRPGALVVALSPTQRQSAELLGHARSLLPYLPIDPHLEAESVLAVRLGNGSRIVALPGATPATIRGYSAPDLLLIDEAAYVADATIDAARPALAVSDGDFIALSTPAARAGWFYRAWEQGGDLWERFRVSADEVTRISPDFLAAERATMTEATYLREYGATFTDAERAVFSAGVIETALVDDEEDSPCIALPFYEGPVSR